MRLSKKMSAGTAITTTQAPSVNLVRMNTMVAMAVTVAPRPLRAARNSQRGGRVRHQCTTRPLCDSVKPVNTPMANSGISVSTFPRTAMSSTADARDSAQIPGANFYHRLREKFGRLSSMR